MRIFVISVFAVLFCTVQGFSQSRYKIANENGKYGVVYTSNNTFVIQPEYEEVHKVLKSFYENGYICRKGEVWTYYNYVGEFIADSIDMDAWVGNSYKDHGWVLKDERVYMYDFNKLKCMPISADTINYRPGELIVEDNHDSLYGIFNTNGEILVDFQWKEYWTPFKSTISQELPYLFTNEDHEGGAFYDDKGELILKFDYKLTFLGNQSVPYLRIDKKGLPQLEGRQALAILDTEKKKIKFLTGYDFWYMNVTRHQDENGAKAVAKAAYPDRREVYIYADGSTKPVQSK